jgi:hypothetical protein
MVGASQRKESTVATDHPIENVLLAPPEWDIDWDDLLLLDDLPLTRAPWYADWDECE